MSVRLWSSVAWREQAVGWIDRRLAGGRPGADRRGRAAARAPVGDRPARADHGRRRVDEGGGAGDRVRGRPLRAARPRGARATCSRRWPSTRRAAGCCCPTAGRRSASASTATAGRRSWRRRSAQYGRLQRSLAPHAGRAAGARRARHAAGGDARALRGGARGRARQRAVRAAGRAPSPSAASPAGTLAAVEALRRRRGALVRAARRLARAGEPRPQRPAPAERPRHGPVPLLRLGRRRGRPRVRGDARAVAGARRAAARPRPRRLPGGLRRPRPADELAADLELACRVAPHRPHADLGARAALGTRRRTSRSTPSSPTPPTRNSPRCWIRHA